MATAEDVRPQRPRTSSMLSFSGRSHKSSGSAGKIDLVESPKDKMARKITGKADPSVAINEVTPFQRNLEASTMAPLRSMQHRDSFGNVITDPDRSNPTRPRLERPLDTIRSFETAIDGSYNRRYSVQPDMQSRRGSYYQAAPTPRTPGGSNGYFDRQPNSRPDSIYGDSMNDRGYPQADRGYHQHERPLPPNGAHYGHHQQRRYPPRNHSEPVMYGNAGVYGNGAPSPVTPVGPAAQGQWTHPSLANASYDAAGTASTSGSYATDHGTNSTEASLHNSSYGELSHQQYKPQPPPHDAYGGFSQGPPGTMEDEYGQPINPMQRNRGFMQRNDAGPPPPPAHGRGTLRKAVPQDDNNSAQAPSAEAPPPPPKHSVDKRKSWLARRFSKNS